jgi:hypothetical protein
LKAAQHWIIFRHIKGLSQNFDFYQLLKWMENFVGKDHSSLPELVFLMLSVAGLALVRKTAQIKKGLVDTSVLAQLGMKCCGHDFSLPDRDRVSAFGGKHLNPGAQALNFWRADENHFGWDIFQLPLKKVAQPDRAINLASVGVSTNGNVNRVQASLFWVFNFSCQKNRARASAQRGLGANKFFQFLESGLAQEL